MSYLDRTLNFLHQQGWSYGMIRYLDTVTGEEVYPIDAHHLPGHSPGEQGGRWEIGRGNCWTEAARDLVKKVYDIKSPVFH